MASDPSRAPASADDLYEDVRRLAPKPTQAPPMRAATVILWRRAGAEIEIFLVRRAPSMAFLGGYWSFPGGHVDDADGSADAAAVRELAEETGVTVDAAALVAAGRWQTPDYSRWRIDASYFLAEAPPGARPDAARSGGELDAGEWMTPRDALARIAAGHMLTPSPVLRCLRALEPGREGAEERLVAAAAAERASPRYWELAPTVAAVPLASPTLPPATHTNCVLLGDGELVVIDPAAPDPGEQAILDRVLDDLSAAGRRVVAVWLTHHHGDHIAGAARVAARFGVPIGAHRLTAERLRGRIEVGEILEDGHRRALGGAHPTAVCAVFTPGHAPGHLCFLDEATRFVAAGDMVAGVGTILVDPSDGDMAEYLASLERLRALAPRALLPAHGPGIPHPIDKLDEYRRHRLWREGRVLAALSEAPRTVAALVTRAYADTPAALHGLAARSLLAHLGKLAAEGKARQSDGGWALL